ncbi:MAG TPA: SMC-Scp complex subunit ScpB [Thermoplasmatales archaeon]|nr:SMC-Scp complex subunit ScpB [Thermoplasmatales archaeon]
MSSDEEVRLVESALFSAGRAISIDEIKEATGLSPKKIKGAIDELIRIHNESDASSMEIVKAGSKYAMQLKPVYAEHTRKLAKPEIPFHVMKTLALIAYHQPIRQADLRRMIGPKVYDHVDILVEKKLVNAKPQGSTELLTTSRLFPEYFGIDSTKPEEIREFLARKTGIKK